jgi:hypothetical protein
MVTLSVDLRRVYCGSGRASGTSSGLGGMIMKYVLAKRSTISMTLVDAGLLKVWVRSTGLKSKGKDARRSHAYDNGTQFHYKASWDKKLEYVVRYGTLRQIRCARQTRYVTALWRSGLGISGARSSYFHNAHAAELDVSYITLYYVISDPLRRSFTALWCA